jgi:phosphoribosylanthranilate isomerase
MLIKICGMRESANIQEVEKLRPDLMGFIFYLKSKRYVGEDFNPEHMKLIRPEIQKVGVFVNEIAEKVIDIAHKFNLNFIQLHGDESPEYCGRLKDEGFKIIKAFGIYTGLDWNKLIPYAEVSNFFLFDTSTKEYGGSGKKFEWSLLSSYKIQHPYILSGGIDIEDVNTIKKIKASWFAGIDINSCFEVEPAKKDVEKIKIFIERIRETGCKML